MKQLVTIWQTSTSKTKMVGHNFKLNFKLSIQVQFANLALKNEYNENEVRLQTCFYSIVN